MTCPACGAPKICAGCEAIAWHEDGAFTPEQARAMDAYIASSTGEEMRKTYYALADVDLPLCNVPPEFSDAAARGERNG